MIPLFDLLCLTHPRSGPFQLHYTFPRAYLLREPLLVVGFVYLLFLAIIVYVRLDFAIAKDEASESRLRVASLVEQVQAVQDRRSALYQSYEDAINKFKSSKDATAFAANRKRIDADHRQLTAQITTLASKLKAEGADVVEKVSLSSTLLGHRARTGSCISNLHTKSLNASIPNMAVHCHPLLGMDIIGPMYDFR